VIDRPSLKSDFKPRLPDSFSEKREPEELAEREELLG
jgi:hypothetical protein